MASPYYFNRNYDEAVGLMVEARDYMRTVRCRGRRLLVGRDGVNLNRAALGVTSRLAHVVAWLMTQRAVQDGEMTAEEALADFHRLSGGDVCLDESHDHDCGVPPRLRSLMERSRDLYLRIERLERMVRDRRQSQ